MANTKVGVILASGMGTLTLKLFPFGSDVQANPTGSGDAMTEAANRDGLYEATVAEALSGCHHAHVYNSSGGLVAAGFVPDLADDTNLYIMKSDTSLPITGSVGSAGSSSAIGGRRFRLAPRNDNTLYVRGIIDETDPTESDGSPKWIDDAVVTWDIRSAEFPAGIVVASGAAVPILNGAYRCDLSHSIALAVANGYWVHVVATTTGGFVADFSDSFEAITRTGRTPTS